MRIGSDCGFIYIRSKHLHLHKGVPGGTDFHICNSWLQRELGHMWKLNFPSVKLSAFKNKLRGSNFEEGITSICCTFELPISPPANTIIFRLHIYIYITSVQQRGDVYMDAEHEGKIGLVCACKGRLQKRLLIFTCLSKMSERGWLINNARKL